MPGNGCDYLFEAFIDIGLGEPEHGPPLLHQLHCPQPAALDLLRAPVRAAIKLDHKFVPHAGEIDDIAGDRVLALEAVAGNPALAQTIPENYSSLWYRFVAGTGAPGRGQLGHFHHDAPWTNHWGLRVSGP